MQTNKKYWILLWNNSISVQIESLNSIFKALLAFIFNTSKDSGRSDEIFLRSSEDDKKSIRLGFKIQSSQTQDFEY